ncbi:MAG: hypothetical protein ACREQZ_09720 [Woeseiaceae bacterium]
MTSDFVMRHWSVLAASALILAVAFRFLFQHVGRSPSGQLRQRAATLAAERRNSERAHAATQKAEARLDRLMQRAGQVRPSQLQEAKDALTDARALQKIADDKVLIAENHLRRVIHEEFPPARQARLRQRFLPDQAPDRRPFSF